MIEFLPRWNLRHNRPTFYDTDSVTMLELASNLHGKMNELIEDYNTYVDSVNKTMTEFINSEQQDEEAFRTALRQEFQDFIDVVDLKLKDQDQEIQSAKSYLQTNLSNTLTKAIEEALKGENITIGMNYDPDAESLNMIITGG